MSVIRNRLEKNNKKIQTWADRHHFEAYRIYDLDIPEYPFLLDRYGDKLLFFDRSNPEIARDQLHLTEAKQAIMDLFKITKDQIFFKERDRQKGLSQYEKQASNQRTMIVGEGPLRFEVNLSDYLDTGLFLDHRPLRERLLKEAKNLKVLNLFCYTGSLSVASAHAGAQVTSIDMSATYLAWAERNFEHNKIDLQDHRFFRQDIMQYLAGPTKDTYDLILLDPPTFSNSKKMQKAFEVERDQEFLVDNCMLRLKKTGLLIFSNNKRKFRITEPLTKKYKITNITEKSLPYDFHAQSTHQCFEIRHP